MATDETAAVVHGVVSAVLEDDATSDRGTELTPFQRHQFRIAFQGAQRTMGPRSALAFVDNHAGHPEAVINAQQTHELKQTIAALGSLGEEFAQQ